MAVQTKSYCEISFGGELALEVFMEYQDDDFQTINDDGDPDDFRVIRWFGENHSDDPITVSMVRGNGQHWQDHEIPPHTSFSQNAGGSVKYESDIPVWRFR
jgi:hypothetical protein